MLNFFLSVLKVLSNTILDNIHKNFWITKTLLKKNLEFNLKQENYTFGDKKTKLQIGYG